jgi:hypothetical protein
VAATAGNIYAPYVRLDESTCTKKYPCQSLAGGQILLCPVHASARDLLTALKALLDGGACNYHGDCRHHAERARVVIQKAEAKP